MPAPILAEQVRESYQQFFEQRGHRRLPSAPLRPENDPSVLFTTAGMQPLAPYLLGEPHPLGRRLVNVQRCLRTNDIEEVGDASHLTFFEMLGNWSLGDYFKEQSLPWSYEYLTGVLGLDPGRLSATVFAGDEHAPRDEQSYAIWRKLGLPAERIYYLPRAENWWGPVGETGPCGPDSEIFYDTGGPEHPGCRPGCGCGRYVEVGNNVFMAYRRTPEGRYEPLSQPNVDVGLGLDRLLLVLNGLDDVFQIDTVQPLVARLEALSGRRYQDNPAPFRVISDHLRAASLAAADGVYPSNVEAGYVVRRLVRRALVHARQLGIEDPLCEPLAAAALDLFVPAYPELAGARARAVRELAEEEARFQQTLARGLRQYRQAVQQLRVAGTRRLSGETAFDLFQTYGFPLPITVELAAEEGLQVDEAGYQWAFEEHQALSRRGQEQKFRGGLADHSPAVTRLHTATHLLHAALRQVLGPHVQQKGSNITPERLRFDFSHPERLSAAELAAVEALVNARIQDDLPVTYEVLPLETALEEGALAFFGEQYGEQVKVYSIGGFSKEVCGGPHAAHTGELGHFRIAREGSVGRGLRRVRAVLE